MSLFDDAMAVGLAAIKESSGKAAVYRRGTQTCNVTAIPGRSAGTVETNQNLRVRSVIRDWLIDAVEIDFGNGPVEPIASDRLEFAGGATFEAFQPGGSESPAVWHDLGRTRWRIHTMER